MDLPQLYDLDLYKLTDHHSYTGLYPRYAFRSRNLDSKKIFIRGTRKMKRKKVADVVEALIGAYNSKMLPNERHFQLDPEKLVNVHHIDVEVI
ncbi:hypothetical protein LINPERPRIM_LOCUS40393 [Linum perenne]